MTPNPRREEPDVTGVTGDLVSEVTAALEAATPGPWYWWQATHDRHRFFVCGGPTEPNGEAVPAICDAKEDAHLIANAPTWLATLTARITDLEAENHKLRHAFNGKPRIKDKAMDLARIQELKARITELEAALRAARDTLFGMSNDYGLIGRISREAIRIIDTALGDK